MNVYGTSAVIVGDDAVKFPEPVSVAQVLPHPDIVMVDVKAVVGLHPAPEQYNIL